MKYRNLKIFVTFSLFCLAINSMAGDFSSEKDRLSYAIGVQIGHSLRQQDLSDKVDPKIIAEAISDVFSGGKLKLTQQEMTEAVQSYQRKVLAENKARAEKSKSDGDAFRAKNKKRKGVVELPNGIQYEILKNTKGPKPQPSSTVTVHYHGTLIDGKTFDSSVKRGNPATFPLNGVIRGWQEILPMIPVGAKWKVVIPPELAYGAHGQGSIDPNATLIFEIELISIK
ncbi:MAG: FKBP-type peptidyl-prolyl cis-trans isomerase [Gammaproteobacteria bacterium]|nr:FKBP-type peptidyl-prolyl cis-trans isomerase [Gammaproteobacteria bacterium]